MRRSARSRRLRRLWPRLLPLLRRPSWRPRVPWRMLLESRPQWRNCPPFLRPLSRHRIGNSQPNPRNPLNVGRMANPVNPLNPLWSASITASVESMNTLETSPNPQTGPGLPNQLEMENTQQIFFLQHGPLIGVGLPLSRLVFPGPQTLHGPHRCPQIGPGLINQQMVEITPGPQPGHGPPLIGLGLLLSRLVFPGPQTLHGLHQSRLIGPGLLNQQGSQSPPTANPANPATPLDPQPLLIQELRNPGCVSVGLSHNLE